MSDAVPGFGHLWTMTDEQGTYEHAKGAVARTEHGYCTDDVARVLVVATREPHPTAQVRRLAHSSLRFVADAQDLTGACRNRKSADGRWRGAHTVEDCWGRSLWAFGVAAADRSEQLGRAALAHFDQGAQQRSPWPRAMAFAALGASAVTASHPGHRSALELLEAVGDVIGTRVTGLLWPWPEPRLTYANAVLPDAMIATGTALHRPTMVDDGLELLDWLLARETVDEHLSVTPVGGAGPHDAEHGFDQQPIEVASMADACARAWALTGEPRWANGIRMAAAWFDGSNDSASQMWDCGTSGGYDGLEADGFNRNQGAESTIALISTHQQAQLLSTVPA
jgi:hypothetical protein